MMSSTGAGGQEAQMVCGFCGYTDVQGFTFCPRCGQAVRVSGPVDLNAPTRPSTPLARNTGEMFGPGQMQPGLNAYSGEQTQPGSGEITAGAGQTQPNTSGYLPGGYQPSGPVPAGMPAGGFGGAQGWQTHPSGAMGGLPQGGGYVAGPVNGQFAGQVATSAPKRRWSRGRRVGVIVGALLVVLLVGSAAAYVVYAAFFAYSPTDSARYLPATTVMYSSFDLQQVQQNSHGVTQSDVASTTNTSGFEQATGLDFQKDVVPWLKRSFSFAVVDVSTQGGGEPTGTVFLLATHDTTASQATIQKVMTTQQQKYGVTFTKITYQGVTLESDADAVGSQNVLANPVPALVMGIVNDQVIIANSVQVAEEVVDRAKGNGSTLAQDATFTAAMGKLPNGRFGTLYVNLHQLLSDLHLSDGAAGQSVGNHYPAAYGSIEFTSVGMRVSFTVEEQGTAKSYPLTGDTNASAAVVPANTLLFAGLGNLSGFYQSLRDGSNGLVTDQGFTQTVGLSPEDTLFQSPASVALLSPGAGSNDVVEPLVMLHSSLDAGTISSKVQQALQTLGYETSSSTLSGVTVTKVQASQSAAGSQTVYYAVLGHDLVFSYDTDGLSQAIDTYKGQTASLASLALFKTLVAQGPKTNALTLFFNLTSLSQAQGQLGDVYRQLVKGDATLAKVTGMYTTYNANGSGITVTEDIALK